MYLVEFTKSSGKLIIDDDGIYAIGEFLSVLEKKGYGEPMMRAIALLVDYYSPFRHRPESERHIAVAREVFGKGNESQFKLDCPIIEGAIAKYKFLQVDPYREELAETRKTLHELAFLKRGISVNEDTVNQIKNIMKSIETFEDRYESLKEKIDTEADAGPVANNLSLYRLEKTLVLKEQFN